jgi:NADH-quinone oxidoreductase subunit J
MEMNPAVFFIFSGAAIAFSLFTILKKNPVASAFSLVMVFFCFAGIYGSLAAHLIATLQILVYAGAIMVLFIFVIMLLNADEPSFDVNRAHPIIKVFAGIFGVVFFLGLVYVFKKSSLEITQGGFSNQQVDALGGNSKVISQLMFSKYLLPFELTSVLLLAAIVGAIAIAKRKQENRS